MSRSILRSVCFAGAVFVVVSAVACRTSPAARMAVARAVLIRIDSVGVRGIPGAPEGMRGRVLIYADGPARLGVGTAEPTALTDTMRLRTLPAFTVDVAQSDVHVEWAGDDAAAGGSLTIGGSVTGGAATHVGATGRHLLLLKGGTGIRVLQ